MRWGLIFIVLLCACKDDRIYYHVYPVKNSHYFDFKADSLVFLVQDGFRSNREVWVRNPSIIAVNRYFIYKRYSDFHFLDSIRLGFGENVLERTEFQKTMPLRVYSLYLMSDTTDRFVLANGSTILEMRGFYKQKKLCPSIFFSGKYIQTHHETTNTINDSISARQITREWYARDSGLIYFERTSDSLKYGKPFSSRKESARRTNF